MPERERFPSGNPVGSASIPGIHPERVYLCDRCGSVMVERRCKVSCPNCGNRFDCSDLTLHFEEFMNCRR